MQDIGPYRIINKLASSRMGILYLAQHRRNKCKVALKTIPVPEVGLARCIRREVRALSKLDHPGFVGIVEQGLDQGIPWYTMELVNGIPLNAYWSDKVVLDVRKDSLKATTPGILNWDVTISADQIAEQLSSYNPVLHLQGVRIGYRLCDALAYLHGEGMVHRDIKPENIMIKPDGSPVIIDFGLMIPFDQSVSREQLRLEVDLVGTADYMSPEQIRRQAIDARADLYALGCILYELLTGHTPFWGKDYYQIIKAHLEGIPKPLTDCIVGLPHALNKVVMQLLAKDPSQRFAYAEDVAEQLRIICDDKKELKQVRKQKPYLYRPQLRGREKPMQELVQFLDQLEQGVGGLILIEGESGVGKTRLALEVGFEATLKNIRVLTGECSELKNQPLEAFQKPIQTITDWCRERGQELTDRIFGARSKILVDYFGTIGDLPGFEQYPEPGELPLESSQQRLFNVLSQSLKAFSEELPLLIITDDLHWADSLLLEFMEYLEQQGGLQRFPLLLMGTYRSEEINPFLHKIKQLQTITIISLQRLDEQAVISIVSDMIALPEGHQLFSKFIALHSEGNPFFVIEYLRTAIAKGILTRDNYGQWSIPGIEEQDPTKVEREFESLPVPITLKDMILNRLQHLHPSTSDLVDVASVLGRELDLTLLEEILTSNEEVLWDGIDELLGKHILERTTQGKIKFSHDKIRECIYHLLDQQKRTEFHRLAAETIERLHPSLTESYALSIGHHWEQAGNSNRAREHYFEVARGNRLKLSLYDYERLSKACIRLAEESSVESIDAHYYLGSTLYLQGRIDEAIVELEKVVLASQAVDYLAGEVDGYRALGELYSFQWELEKALSYLRRALTLAQKHGDLANEGMVIGILGDIYKRMNEYDQARECYEKAIESHRLCGKSQSEGITLYNLALLYVDQGNIDEAHRLSEEALHILAPTNDLQSICLVKHGLASIEANRGYYLEAYQHYEEVLQTYLDIGDRRLLAYIYNNLGVISRDFGELDQSEVFIRKALTLFREVKNRGQEAVTLANLAYTRELQDHLPEVLQRYKRALSIFQELQQDVMNEGIMALMSVLTAHQGDIDQSLNYYSQALHLLEKKTKPVNQGETNTLLAKVDRLIRSDFKAAAEKLRISLGIFKQIGNPLLVGNTLCEQGHLQLAQSRSAESILDEVRDLVTEYQFPPQSLFNQAVQQLDRAQNLFTQGKFDYLYRGTYLLDLPAQLRQKIKTPTPDDGGELEKSEPSDR